MRAKLLRQSEPGTPERQKEAYEAAREYIRVCPADGKYTEFVRRWVEKYDAAVREFELKRSAAELRGTPGANAADALKGLLTKTR
jgi:hypothetical protein